MYRKAFFGVITLLAIAMHLQTTAAFAMVWDSIVDNFQIDEGSGTWKNNDVNFRNWTTDYGYSNVVWPMADADAQFGNISATTTTDRTITVSGGVTANSLTFYQPYTLVSDTVTPGVITLNSYSPSISVPAATSMNIQPKINVAIASSAEFLDINGYGGSNYSLLFLGGENTYTSTLRINGGFVAITNPAALSANSAGITVSNGSTLRIDAAGTYDTDIHISGYGVGATTSAHTSRAPLQFSTYTGTSVWTGNIVLDSDSSISASNPAAARIEGVISGGYKLTKTSDGLVTLANRNTYTGGTDIFRGTLELNAVGGPAILGNVTFTHVSTSYPKGLWLAGDDQLEPTAVVTFSGVANSEVVRLNGHRVTVAGIASTATSSSLSAIENGVADTVGTLIIDTPADVTHRYRGYVRDGAGKLAVVKRGAGKWLLEGGYASQYTGGLTIEGGTLAFGGSMGTELTIGSSVEVKTGATFDLTSRGGNKTIVGSNRTLNGDGTVLGNITIGSDGTVSAGSSIGTLNVTGNLGMTGAGNMRWELGALSTANPGADFDQLVVGGSLDLGTLANLTLDFNTMPAALRPDYSAPDPFWSSSHSWLIINNGENTPTTNFATFANSIFNSGVFNTEAVAGGIQLNFIAHIAADLIWRGNVNNDWDVATTANWLGADGYFRSLDKVTFNDTGLQSNVELMGVLDPQLVTVDNNSLDYVFSGTGSLTGSGGLTKNGTGTLTIANTGSFVLTGPIALNGGTLAVNHGDDVNLIGLSGAGNLRQEGTGVLTVAGDSINFSGDIAVVAGTLKAGTASGLGNATGGTTIANGATLDVNSFNLGNEQITVSGSGVGGNGAIVSTASANQQNALKYVTFTGDTTLGGSAGRWDIRSGTISADSPFNLTKNGTNTINFSSCVVTPNLGNIDIQGGTLYFEGVSTMGNPTATASIASGATLAFYSMDQEMEKVVVSNGGTIYNQRGTTTFNGPISVAGGTDTSFTVDTDSTLILNNNVTGGAGSTAGLIKKGGGALKLNKAGTYAGTTTFSAGTLELNSDSGYAVPGNIVYNGSATLRFDRGDETNEPQMNPSATVTFTDTVGSQQVYLQGHGLTLEGLDILNYGTVSDSAVAIQNGTANTSSLLVIDSEANHCFRGKIRDNGGTLALLKKGVGTQALLGVGTGAYTGGLTVQGGTLTVDVGQGAAGVLPAAGLVAVTGGTLDLGGTFQTVNQFQITSGLVSGSPSASLASRSDFDVQGGTVEVNLTDPTALPAVHIGLTKTTAGVVTLTNGCYYSGPTAIREGVLALAENPTWLTSGSLPSSPLIQISANATFSVSGLAAGYTVPGGQTVQGFGSVDGNLTISGWNYDSQLGAGSRTAGGTLTLSNNLTADADANLEFDLSSAGSGANNDKIAVVQTLALPTSGTVNLAIHGLAPTLDTANPYVLMTYGTLSSGNVSNLAVKNNTRYTMTPSIDTTNRQIKLNVSGTAPYSLAWVGDTSYTWDLKTSTNWKTATLPNQAFYELDAVRFDNTAAYTIVYVSGSMRPSSVTIENDDSHPYYFVDNGGGKISGPAGIQKSGVGLLNIAMPNDFAGNVVVVDGTLQVGNSAALGSTDGQTIVAGTGTLDLYDTQLLQGEEVVISGAGFNGQGALINSVIPQEIRTFSHVNKLSLAGNATIGGVGDWKVGGNLSAVNGGGYTLTKIGGNTVGLVNVGNTGLGDINITEGVLDISQNTTLGIANKTITIANNATLSFSQNSGSTEHDKILAIASSGGRVLVPSGAATYVGDAMLGGNANIEVAASSSLTFKGGISGPGGLTVNGTGDLILAGSNSYTGGTTLSAGASSGAVHLNSTSGYAIPGNVVFTAAARLHLDAGEENGGQPQVSPSTVLIFSDAAGSQYLELGGHSITLEGVEMSNYATTTDDRAALENWDENPPVALGVLTIDAQNDHNYRGVIRDNVSPLAIVKRGPGTQAFWGTRCGEYTGGLTVEEGTLDYSNGALPKTTYTVTGGNLKIGNRSQTIGQFQITGGLVEATTAVLTSNLDFDIQGGTVQADLAGTTATVGLKKSGLGTATLAGDLLYTGNTTVYEGTLSALAINTPDATIAVASGATLNATSLVADTLTIGGTPTMVAAAAVPEPSTMALLLVAGLALAGAYLRRK